VAVIDVAGIGKSYRLAHGRRIEVLADIALRLEEGAILGLLGPNGAGKTTLIKILCGLLRPDAGGGSVLGHDLLREPAAIRAHVSLVAPTADVGTDNNLTVRQNLAFWAPVYGLRGLAARRRIDELLQRLDLAQRADFWPMHISAGERQRLALARSLLAKHPLIFLDEPTNKLDFDGVRSVRELIVELNRDEGVTVLLTTHVMEEAEELCSEVALLRAGRLVAKGSAAHLAASLGAVRPIMVSVRGPVPPCAPDLPGVVAAAIEPAAEASTPAEGTGTWTLRLRSADIRATTRAVLAWLEASGLELLSMRSQPVTLEDVFALAAQG
jgi:ABC-2 type transport system ATP-binding protein